ncbi:hypothetical protein T11_14984 [Trichinella zimbabwensis]|uniref:Uncharacterized protein n=1 Tax=Trichinella zimbabwensis TaxID=268475 RepID=A0A0V1HB04_9BILA|nr:hypothetical protein T11_14984 [Trichinella zimbabwensis]
MYYFLSLALSFALVVCLACLVFCAFGLKFIDGRKYFMYGKMFVSFEKHFYLILTGIGRGRVCSASAYHVSTLEMYSIHEMV